MTGRRTKLVIAAVALMATSAEGAAAQQPATFGGGRFPPSAAGPKGYVPTVGISLQPRGGRIAMRYDSSLACGRDVFDIVGRGEVPFDGTTFSLRGASIQNVARGRLAFEWTVNGKISGGIATGTLHVVGVRRISGRHGAARRSRTAPSRPRVAARRRAVPRGRSRWPLRRHELVRDRRRAPGADDAARDQGRPQDHRALDDGREVPPRRARVVRERHACLEGGNERGVRAQRALQRPLRRRARPLPDELRRARADRRGHRHAAAARPRLQPQRQKLRTRCDSGCAPGTRRPPPPPREARSQRRLRHPRANPRPAPGRSR